MILKKHQSNTIITLFLFLLTFTHSLLYSQESTPYLQLDSISKISNANMRLVKMTESGYYYEGKELYELHPSIRYYEKGGYMDSLLSLENIVIKDISILDSLLLGKQIVIINEAHHNAYHRIFVTQLLEKFYDAGFRALAIEALPTKINQDIINKAAYFSDSLSLNYVTEPFFARLVSKANVLGFNIIPYEAQRKGNREIIQAVNIYNSTFKDNPDTKLLIYCGYSHYREEVLPREINQGNSIWMARYLKDLTGIDPLTIDQETLNERFKYDENPLYKILSPTEKKSGIVFHNNQPLQIEGESSADLYVFHPKTNRIKGRPHWVYVESLIPYSPDSGKCPGFPCQILAYRGSFNEKNVPFDIIELDSALDEKQLLLEPDNSYDLIYVAGGKIVNLIPLKL